MILGIDPGKRHVGYALLEPSKHRLAACGLFKGEGDTTAEIIVDIHKTASRVLLPWVIGIAVVEKPVVYPKSRGKAGTKAPNDLIDVAMVGGSFLIYGRIGVETTVAGWKGQRTKEVCKTHILEELDESEITVMLDGLRGVSSSLHHNVLDGLGIALSHVGRIFQGGRT